ncbi:hypothetical protein BDQ17DRAFT_1364199 [Cyathus striatus]|nr:hypothetical protein BDQ17DRAFT_1364199 [Cyathus striatus]
MTSRPNRQPPSHSYAGNSGVNSTDTYTMASTPAIPSPYVYVQDFTDSPEYPSRMSITPPSSNTPPSSLYTPPSNHYTPPSSVSPPSSNQEVIQVSRFLSYPADQRTSPLPYDLTYPLHSTSSIRVDCQLYAKPDFEAEIQRESAFSPPLSRVTILCPQLPTNLQRLAISRKDRKTLNLFDVLDGIHTHLRWKLNEGDCQSLEPRMDWGAIQREMKHRLARIPDHSAYDTEEGRGVIALDLLNGKHHFLGLSCSGEGSDVWQLHTF